MATSKDPKKTTLSKLVKNLGIRDEGKTPAAAVGQELNPVLEEQLENIAAAHTDIHNSAHLSVPSPN